MTREAGWNERAVRYIFTTWFRGESRGPWPSLLFPLFFTCKMSVRDHLSVCPVYVWYMYARVCVRALCVCDSCTCR